jgi:hypothetical protein
VCKISIAHQLENVKGHSPCTLLAWIIFFGHWGDWGSGGGQDWRRGQQRGQQFIERINGQKLAIATQFDLFKNILWCAGRIRSLLLSLEGL